MPDAGNKKTSHLTRAGGYYEAGRVAPVDDDEKAVRDLYAESVRGAPELGRWGYFDRAAVGALLAEIDRLRAQVAGHAERIAAQSELLSRRSEARPPVAPPPPAEAADPP
jgi:hypothetical protein